MERTYSVEIEYSSKELSAKERLQIKDTSDCIKLDTATNNGPVIIDVDSYAVLNIHNEKSSNPDYKCYVIVDKDGSRYATGSESFFNAFMFIWDELGGTDDWSLKAYRLPSKNRPGKDFITCSVV